jgi:hypothetical protein
MEIYGFINGVKKSLTQLAAESGVSYDTLLARYKAGVPFGELVGTAENGGGVSEEALDELRTELEQYVDAAIAAIPEYEVADGSVTLEKIHSDVTAQALGGMVCDLLWANSSPGSSFAAQTISINLSVYDFIAVEAAFNTSSKDIKNMFFFKKNNDSTYTYHAMIPNDALSYSMNRRFTSTNSSLVFKEGIKNTNGSGTTDNSAVVPLYIYGIKGAQ